MKRAVSLVLALLLVMSLGLAGCGDKATTDVPEETTGTPSPDASGTAEIDTAPADAAEQTADDWLKANGKEGYTVMARVMYPDKIVVTYTKAGAPNLELTVDAKTGEVLEAK